MPKYFPLNFRFSPVRKLVSLFCLFTGIGLLIWYFAQGGNAPSGTKTLFVLDTSLSAAVQDIAGEKGILVSRLDAAKQAVPKLVTEQNALMSFSDVSTLELPFSPDTNTLLATLDILTPTAYGHATSISSVLQSIETLYGGKTPLSVILFTDGENTALASSPSPSVKLSSNITLTVVGMGTEAGGPMLQGYDDTGKPRYKQYEGKDAISRRDTPFLQKLAKTYDAQLFFIEKLSDIESISSPKMSVFSLQIPPILLLCGVAFLLVSIILSPYRLISPLSPAGK